MIAPVQRSITGERDNFKKWFQQFHDGEYKKDKNYSIAKWWGPTKREYKKLRWWQKLVRMGPQVHWVYWQLCHPLFHADLYNNLLDCGSCLHVPLLISPTIRSSVNTSFVHLMLLNLDVNLCSRQFCKGLIKCNLGLMNLSNNVYDVMVLDSRHLHLRQDMTWFRW